MLHRQGLWENIMHIHVKVQSKSEKSFSFVPVQSFISVQRHHKMINSKKHTKTSGGDLISTITLFDFNVYF